tara:strand:+ start:1038 stop:1367 length:330 start_codon:yes stop_codon:yes gene_type:complete
MKNIIIILLLAATSLHADDDHEREVRELKAALEGLRSEISTTRRSEAFRRSRAGTFKLIRMELDGLEKLDTLTADQKMWIVNAGKRAKKNDPFYRPFLTRLYALHYRHR